MSKAFKKEGENLIPIYPESDSKLEGPNAQAIWALDGFLCYDNGWKEGEHLWTLSGITETGFSNFQIKGADFSAMMVALETKLTQNNLNSDVIVILIN